MQLPRLSLPAPLITVIAGLCAVVSKGAELDMRKIDNLVAQGHVAEAQAILEHAAAIEPGNADTHYRLGALLLKQNRAESAVPWLEKAASIRAKSEYYNTLGDACGTVAQQAGMFSRIGWAKKCLAAYESAVALDERNFSARFNLMNFYASAPGFVGGGSAKAYAQAEAIRKLDPLKGGHAYALLYGMEKKYQQAFDQYDELLRQQPDDYPSLYQLGRLGVLSGQQTDRGAHALRQCLRLPVPDGQPGYERVNWRLGQLCEKQGDLRAAAAYYEAALKLDASFAEARESLQKLK